METNFFFCLFKNIFPETKSDKIAKDKLSKELRKELEKARSNLENENSGE